MKTTNNEKFKSTHKRSPAVRIISLLFVVITILSCFSANAFAASSVSSVNCQPTASIYGGQSKFFYVKATGTTCKLKFTCGKGVLDWAGGGVMPTSKAYGTYEVKVYKWDRNKGAITGSCLLDKDIYNSSSSTLSFKAQKNCYYRVQVYFWVANTTAKSYWNKRIIRNDFEGTLLTPRVVTPTFYDDSSWEKFPTIKATNGGCCTLYSSKP